MSPTTAVRPCPPTAAGWETMPLTVRFPTRWRLSPWSSRDERRRARAVRDGDGAPPLPRVPRRGGDLQVRRGDRPPLLPVQPGGREGPHRGRGRLLRGLDDRRLG